MFSERSVGWRECGGWRVREDRADVGVRFGRAGKMFHVDVSGSRMSKGYGESFSSPIADIVGGARSRGPCQLREREFGSRAAEAFQPPPRSCSSW